MTLLLKDGDYVRGSDGTLTSLSGMEEVLQRVLIKLTARQLMLESERIVSNQTEAVYATLTTGFSKMYQDASILLASNKEFSTNGFPEFMTVDPYLSVNLD